MDPLDAHLWSYVEAIGNQTHDVPMPAKNYVPTLRQHPPAAAAAAGLPTPATITASILLGHYNADGTKNQDINGSFRSVADADLHASLDNNIVAGVHVSSCAGTGLIMPTPTSSFTTTTTAAHAPKTDELNMLRSMMKSQIASSEITARLHRGFVVPNQQPSSAGVPTLAPSSTSKYDASIIGGGPIEALGPPSMFPWNIYDEDIRLPNAIGSSHLILQQKKVMPAKGPASVSKPNKSKPKLKDLVVPSSRILSATQIDGAITPASKLVGAKMTGKAKATGKKSAASTWTPDEDTSFLEAIRTHGQQWGKVSKLVGTKTITQVRYHAGPYKKAKAILQAPSAALTASDFFAQQRIGSVKRLFPNATVSGLRYLSDSKWRTLEPELKASFLQMAEKDAARYAWEMEIFTTILDHRSAYGCAIKNIRAEIRAVFPNISKEGEERLFNERARHLQL